jgi:hypothetical protein
MVFLRKKCNENDCNNFVWSKGKCKDHTPKTSMKSSGGLKKSSSIIKWAPLAIKSFDKAVKTSMRYELFYELWAKRGNKSEVSGTKLYGEPSSAYFHHIIPKGKYPEGDLDENNIIILTMDEHDQVEKDMFIFDEVNKRRDLLLIKYNLI